ncbi:Rv1733c family protein [Nakamurella sp. GG22]
MATDHRPADPHRHHGKTLSVWRNPLARGPDRLQAAAAMAVAILWALALPIVATGGSMLWQQVSTVATQQARTLTATVATLDADPPVPGIGVYGVPVKGEAPVAAHWLAPDGTVRSGTVTVGSDTGDETAVGATQVPVWLDAAGNPADPPLDSGTAAILVVVSTVGAWFMVGVILWTAWLTLRWRLDRQRAAAWDQEWAQVEPLWSGR